MPKHPRTQPRITPDQAELDRLRESYKSLHSQRAILYYNLLQELADLQARQLRIRHHIQTLGYNSDALPNEVIF